MRYSPSNTDAFYNSDNDVPVSKVHSNSYRHKRAIVKSNGQYHQYTMLQVNQKIHKYTLCSEKNIPFCFLL